MGNESGEVVRACICDADNFRTVPFVSLLVCDGALFLVVAVLVDVVVLLVAGASEESWLPLVDASLDEDVSVPSFVVIPRPPWPIPLPLELEVVPSAEF